MHLGTAFQLIDDVLDYSGDAARDRQEPRRRPAEGKPTLPLIRALAVRHAGGSGADPRMRSSTAAD